MHELAPPGRGIPGTARSPRDTGQWSGRTAGSPEHSSGAGYACRATADRCHIVMAADPAMVPHARRCTRQALTAWRLDPVADDAELIVSELTTNAVRASSASASVVALYLALDLDRLYIMVWDDNPEPPARPAHADDDAEAGRGLSIVAMLSDQCGTVPAARGKIVWSRIATTVS